MLQSMRADTLQDTVKSARNQNHHCSFMVHCLVYKHLSAEPHAQSLADRRAAALHEGAAAEL